MERSYHGCRQGSDATRRLWTAQGDKVAIDSEISAIELEICALQLEIEVRYLQFSEYM